jgi:hypothetical protein
MRMGLTPRRRQTSTKWAWAGGSREGTVRCSSKVPEKPPLAASEASEEKREEVVTFRNDGATERA